MDNEKCWTYLGFAARAGKAPSGEFQTENAVKQKKARVVILAKDASDNTKKQFINMCNRSDIPCVELADKETLGHAIGKEFRSSCAIIDKSLAEAFLKSLREDS